MKKTKHRPWKQASLWMLFLGPFFFLIYGVTNRITSLRLNVPSFYFEWEKFIPVIPFMIIPYVSIDLFFAGSVFLCKNKQELTAHVKRIIYAICISAVCFLIFPLRFGFLRPEIDGFYGVMFNLLASLDKPFNQAPSLHISLLMILWVMYNRHSRGMIRYCIHGWFFMVGASVLFTFQHHVVDIPTGIIVGITAFYLFPDKYSADCICTFQGNNKNQLSIKIACIYFLIAVFFCISSYFWKPISLLMFWPCVAFLLVSFAYAKYGTAVFRKLSGRHSLSSRILLAPYYLGAYFSFRFYTRSDHPYDEVVPGIIIGRKLSNTEACQAIDAGVTSVLDLTAEFYENMTFLKLPYLNLQILDLTLPTIQQLHQAAAFTEKHRRNGKVYIHCALGYSRSACIIAACLIKMGTAETAEEAIKIIKKVKPKIVLTKKHISLLRKYTEEISNGVIYIGQMNNPDDKKRAEEIIEWNENSLGKKRCKYG